MEQKQAQKPQGPQPAGEKAPAAAEPTPQALYDRLRARLQSETSCTETEIDLIDRAYRLAAQMHSAQLRYSGQPYIIHPLAVANILVDFGMDAPSIAAALLHDTVETRTRRLSS